MDSESTLTALLVPDGFKRELLRHFRERWNNEPCFKWILVGSSIYVAVQLTSLNVYSLWPVKNLFEYFYNKYTVPESVLIYFGEVESEIAFGRLGYTRCLETDTDVLEKYGIPMNTDKCLRDGIQALPGEFYPQFDLSEYDPKVTPLAWSYGPIQDPGLITPIGWYNDMNGENMEFEMFARSMRIFGYLPESCYEELYKYCKIKLLRANQRLIRTGDPDDKLYIILQGAVDVYSNRIGAHHDFIRLRTATHGGNIGSLFSIIDAFSGNARNIQSIYAVAKLNTTKVLIFPLNALKDYLVRNPQYLVTAVMRVMERGFRFQYTIMHVSLQLTSVCTILNPELSSDPPNVDIPSSTEEISARLKEKAIRNFMEFLEMDDFDFLRQHCQVLVIDPEEPTSDMNAIRSSILNHRDWHVYTYVYIGKVEVFYLKSNLSPLEQKSKRKPVPETVIPEPLTTFNSGEGIGSLIGLFGYFHVLFNRCVEKSIIVTLDRPAVEKILDKNPLSVFPIAYCTVSKMSPFIRAMDFAVEWNHAKEGQYIYHKEQLCYDSYLIVSGRARAYQLEGEAAQRAILEYKENDWMGIIESLLQTKRRSKTCVVIRETEFVKIPNDLLRNLVISFPEAAQVMLEFLVNRTLRSRNFEMSHLPQNELEQVNNSSKQGRTIHSIALCPVAESLPYALLAVEIKKHFLSYGGSCCILTYEKTLEALRKPELTKMEQFLLEMYILRHLEQHDLVIFICVPKKHYWNEVCSTHSEVIFSVCCSEIPNISTVPPDFEEEIAGKKITTRRKELIILHSMDVTLPKNTKEWLCCRDWASFHHHIRLPKSAFELLGAFHEEYIEANYRELNREIIPTSDLSRFYRWIQGKTVGVLFSSGGARIGSQLGMLQALHEYKKIPIDMVVGTGSGFLLAACYSIYQNYTHVQNIVEKVFKDLKTISKLGWNTVTFPYVNFGNGKELLMYFYQLFGSVQLEDAWIPICCTTTNLTSHDVRVDRSGPMWVFLRASFSHLASSPPISDPVDLDYMCDGAHSNSMPQDIIKEYGAEYIIAFNTVGGKLAGNIDESADPNTNVLRFIKNLFYTVIKKLGLASPSVETIFQQLASTQTRMYAVGAEAVTNLNHVVYVRPPVEHLPSQTWRNLPTLHRIGYFYMKAILDKNPYREDIPFYVFWTNIKETSTIMAKEGGRELSHFW